MIQCTTCGRTLDKVPNWLSSASVVFVCNNCPNRQAKNIAFLSLETETPKAKVEDDEAEDEIEAEEEAEA
jgi:predicted Fe-S protein YdhL (DUF1289 family)